MILFLTHRFIIKLALVWQRFDVHAYSSILQYTKGIATRIKMYLYMLTVHSSQAKTTQHNNKLRD